MSNDMQRRTAPGLPAARGLYEPQQEHDSCGVGFVCDIKGRASRAIVTEAQHMNCCMEHRGGVGYEQNTGDGAGILLGMPHRFMQVELQVGQGQALGVELGQPGSYGVGNVFLPTEPALRARCKTVLEEEIAANDQTLLGWRALPMDPDGADIGKAARLLGYDPKVSVEEGVAAFWEWYRVHG